MPQNCKSTNMKRVFCTILVFILMSSVSNAQVLSEHSKDLVNGFREVYRAEKVNVEFESIGHFTYLFYEEIKLSQTNTYSISPCGKYALYQDGPSGHIFLFSVTNKRTTNLSKRFNGLIDTIKWNEKNGLVSVVFFEDYPGQTYSYKEVSLNP